MRRNMWGEIPDQADEHLEYRQNVNFNPMIELAMQTATEPQAIRKSGTFEMPTENLVSHTIALHEYRRRLVDLLERAKADGTRPDPAAVPAAPPAPRIHIEHEFRSPLQYLDKDYCDFSIGRGPVVEPVSPGCRRRALRQCAATSVAHVGVADATEAVLAALADALDHYLTTLAAQLRAVVDREAQGASSGFPDPIARVFTQLGVGGLHEFYRARVVEYGGVVTRRCAALEAEARAAAPDVPELHFPAALGATFTPSLEPGFQMLHSLEQHELRALQLLPPPPPSVLPPHSPGPTDKLRK